MDTQLMSAPAQEDVKPIPQFQGSSSSPVRARRPSVGSAPAKIRRRNRLITSCLECRRRKLKCDKLHPCSNCTKFVRDCVFLAPALDAASQLKLNEIKEKMGSLERTLEEDIARRASLAGAEGQGAQGSSSEEEPAELEDERGLEPTPLAVEDAAYYEDSNDDVVDLGVQIGKMRLTERVGGFVRPHFSQEINYVLQERTNFSGFPREIADAKIKTEEDALKPSEGFLTPASGFFFAPEPQRSSFMVYLPSKNVADSLLNHYWAAVHLMARVVHRPTFERQWVQFWHQVHSGQEPRASMQALVMALLLTSIVSMEDQVVMMKYGVPKSNLLQSFQQGAEAALCRANFLRTTKLETLQALVMYLIPLCRREVTRAHSALTGTAIRLAECMGLHRDGTHYGLSPVEVHVRRIVWHELCFLDIRTCEATGPRPQIRKEEFDTKLPLNVNDIDLEGPNPPTEDSDQWTDMTFSRIRFEVYEMHRFTWIERPRLEKKKSTLTSVLSKVQDFVSKMDKKYLPMLDANHPIKKMALLVYKILSLRIHIMFLHRYSSNHSRAMPERLRRIVLTSGVQQVECAMVIETDPSLQPWAWYLGALHQYHTALLLLSELYATNVRYHEDRIWKVLDFVFECPTHLNRKDKAQLILAEIVQKTEIYHSLRRVRAPQDIERALARPPNSEYQTIRQPIVQSVHQSPSPPAMPYSKLGVGRLPPEMEYRVWHPDVREDVQYVPPNTNPPTAATSTTNSTSPQNPEAPRQSHSAHARGGSGSFGSNGSPGDAMLDVDWNEWDRMFPPDTNFSDFGNLPDFHLQSAAMQSNHPM